MRKLPRHYVILLLLCAALNLQAQKTSVPTAATPAWVKPVGIQYDHNWLDKQAEDGYMDVAYIKQINLPEQIVYISKASKIINEQGIENNSEVSVTYDPSYQKLAFHEIKIIREGKEIGKLKGSKFKMLQQEKEAYMHLYDGSLTALLLLEDVRVGDIIQYAYSIKGFNPVFEGKYADNYYAAFSVPIGQLYYRLLADADKPMYVENSNLEATPIMRRNGNIREYEWRFSNVASIHTDDNLPGWYDAYPMVMVSEFNDWLNIRQWAVKLFPNNVAIDALLKKKIDAIVLANPTNDQKATAALRFVQDEVRYLGIEMGTGTHKPSNPNKIFNQRFGDCKDKTYLLVTMLNAMGIKATPVLINSTMKKTIAKYTPSPKAFDHVTARMTVDGRDYYVDPTITNQRGPLASISYPAYQTGLVLADSLAGLTTISTAEPGMVKVKEIFSIPDMNGQATLKVTTINTGGFADDSRSAFKNNSTYELQKTYKQFYSAYFPKIKADSINYVDDERTGAFTINEFYTIDNLWEVEKGVKKCDFSAFVINSYLKRPKDKLRTMPMAMYYPAKYVEEIEVSLPEDWVLRDFEHKVKCSAFRYNGKSTLTGRTINMVFAFETLKDNIEPAEVDELLASYKQIDDQMGWQLTYNTNAGTSTFASNNTAEALPAQTQRNILLRLAIFFSLLIGTVVIVIAKQRRKQNAGNDLSMYGRDKWR